MLCYTVTCPPNHLGCIANIKLKEQWAWSGTNEQQMMSSITNEKQPTSKPVLKTGQDYISVGVSLTNTLSAKRNPCVFKINSTCKET